MPDLTELQRLAEGATPGPWYVDEDPRPGMEWNRHITSGATALTVCFMAHSDGKHPKRDEATANLIAAMSPDTAKKLIAVALAAQECRRAWDVFEATEVGNFNEQIMLTCEAADAALRTALEELK